MNTSRSMKRIVAATLFGPAFGVVCATAAFSAGFLKFTPVNLVRVLLNGGIMGFVIGASGLRLHWAWKGIIYGVAGRIYLLLFPFHAHGAWVGAGG